MQAGRLRVLAGVAMLAAVIVAAPQPSLGQNDGGAVQQPMLLPVDDTPLTVVTKSGERGFSIEIADDAAKRSAGLMHRQTMPDDRGMLFIFEETRPLTFWMKNTPMPLDLVFIAEDGRIVSILPGEPYSMAIIASGASARYVLELKAGTAEREGIAEGDLVSHPRMKGSAAPVGGG